MTRVGFFTWAMTFAIVKVFPEPVTPRRTCCFLPSFIPRTSFSMACGWSPWGVKPETNGKFPSLLYCAMREKIPGILRSGKEHQRTGSGGRLVSLDILLVDIWIGCEIRNVCREKHA